MTEPPPLTDDQRQAVDDGVRLARPVRRAIAVARFDAWCTAIFAAMTMMYVAMSIAFDQFSLLALVVGVGLIAVAYNGFAGLKLLKQFDVRAARRLGFNQLFFFAVITGYCAARIYAALVTVSEQIDQLKQYLEQTYALSNAAPQLSVDEIEQLVRWSIVIIYSAVIFASLLVQGLTALYYFTRGKYVARLRQQTPDWVLVMLRR